MKKYIIFLSIMICTWSLNGVGAADRNKRKRNCLNARNYRARQKELTATRQAELNRLQQENAALKAALEKEQHSNLNYLKEILEKQQTEILLKQELVRCQSLLCHLGVNTEPQLPQVPGQSILQPQIFG
jgi:uncharacterized protein YlxW (UPF0749 family)